MPKNNTIEEGVFFAGLALASTIAFIAGVAAAVCDVAEDEDTANSQLLLTTLAIADEEMNNKRRKISFDEMISPIEKKKRKLRIVYDRDAVRDHIGRYFLGQEAQLPDRFFTRTFHISRSVFVAVFNILNREDKFFRDGYDCTLRRKICPYAKVLAGLKKLAYGVSSISLHTEFGMGISTEDHATIQMCRIISQSELRNTYLCPMSRQDAKRCVDRHKEVYQVDGQLGSLDCTHMYWANCPTALKGQYAGKDKIPTVVLEAVSDFDLWIWFASVGYPGSNSDTVIWDKSPLHKALVSNELADLDFDYEVGDEKYSLLYFLVDEIYPAIARFVQGFQEPIGVDQRRFTKW